MTQKRRDARRQRIAVEWLLRVAHSAQDRIDAGDLDFDDVLYRGRDAANTLLDIFTPGEPEPAYVPRTPAEMKQALDMVNEAIAGRGLTP